MYPVNKDKILYLLKVRYSIKDTMRFRNINFLKKEDECYFFTAERIIPCNKNADSRNVILKIDKGGNIMRLNPETMEKECGVGNIHNRLLKKEIKKYEYFLKWGDLNSAVAF